MKIQCTCGIKYSFEVTPEMARAPITFVCQKCGMDSSQLVNQLVRQELGLVAPAGVASAASGRGVPTLAPPPTTDRVVVRVKAAPAAPPPPLAVSAPTAPQIAHPAAVRVSASGPAAALEAAPAVEAPQLCPKHPGQLAAHRCRVCSKPMCSKCMEVFGYVCSVLCKEKAQSQGMRLPVYARQKSATLAKQGSRVGLILLAACVLLVSGAGFWLWYNFSGSLPKKAFSVRFQDPASSGQIRFVEPNQLVLLHGGTLARHDLKTQKEIWSRLLLDKKKIEEETARIYEKKYAARQGELVSEAFRPLTLPEVVQSLEQAAAGALRWYVRGQNIWVAHPDKLVLYDWQTGQPAKEIPLGSAASKIIPHGDELLLIAAKENGQTVTHVDLASGQERPEEIAAPVTFAQGASGESTTTTASTLSASPKPPDSASVAGKPGNLPLPARLARPAVQAANQNQQRAMTEMKDTPDTVALASTSASATDGGFVIPANIGFVQLTVKPLPAKSGAGGAPETGNRSQVTLRRFGAPGATEWTSEVVGAPRFFPLKTIDVLVAGKSVWVFDATNKKLWESKLNAELMGGFRAVPAGEMLPFGEGPVVEKGDTVYLFDGKELTAFDQATGNPRWRLPSPGIAGLHFDEQGMIYVNAGTDASRILDSVGHVDTPEANQQLIQKIDPKTGRVLWQAEREGLVRYLSGKFLYTTASQRGDPGDEEAAMPVLNTGFQKIPHVRIKRLDPATGRVLWEHYHGHAPLDVRFAKNTFSVLCGKEMRVIRFFSF